MGIEVIITIVCIVGFLLFIAFRKGDNTRNNWPEDAQQKEQNKFDYLNPQLSNKAKKKPLNYARNMTFDEWINDHKNDGFEGNPKEGIRWYPTGWTYNTKTGKWEPPNYLQDQSKEKWEWNEDKQIWIDKEKEARLEKYRKYHEGRPPTFEEWKAAREKENSNN